MRLLAVLPARVTGEPIERAAARNWLPLVTQNDDRRNREKEYKGGNGSSDEAKTAVVSCAVPLEPVPAVV